MAVVNLEAQPPPPENTKRQYNFKFFKSNEGCTRIIEAVLSLAIIILLVAGYCELNTGRHGTMLFVLVVTLIESIFIMIFMAMRFDETVTMVDVPLSLLLNDGILTIFHFIIANLALLSIGSCPDSKGPRITAALFTLILLILMIAQNYFNYQRWQEKRNAQDSGKNSGTTITESSPTVLT
ncbi:uncharacterized protein NPIL_411441 [Nephila pilipes]|uniref:MARVEL domain-containing protein n=1 Tax=Nephila pilipes TaxID=299642 RepID=A0A8X6MG77_NEPPI|nr:uncharacterized protein NPIL_411441 [Nephila pilipes]